MERPQREHGDWATNVALQLAKPAGRPPREIAQRARRPARRGARDQERGRRRSRLPQHHPGRRRGRRAGPHDRRGRRRPTAPATLWPGRTINLEFVSANPTGPIHLGGTRWAAVGDALARILERQRRRGRPASTTSTTTAPRSTGSPARCWPRARGRAGARGRLRRRVHRRHRRRGSLADASRGRPTRTCRTTQAQEVFRAHRRRADVRRDQGDSLHDFGVDFDVYFHENSLHESGAVDARRRPAARARAHLREGRRRRGCAPPTTATTRTASSSSRDGEPAYIAGDLAYYLDKRERGFDRVDHHARRRPPRLHRRG